MCPGTDQRWWHSIHCHLHIGGRHHWTLLRWDRHTPKVCFGFWWLDQSFSFIPVTKCWLQHRVTKAMVLGEESIRLHTSSPSTALLRAYIAVTDGWLSSTQSLNPDREEVPQPSPSNPPRWEGCMPISHGPWRCSIKAANAGPLPGWGAKGIGCTPRDPPLGHLGSTAGEGDPDVDDEEVTFQRGRVWEPRGHPPWNTGPLNQTQV